MFSYKNLKLMIYAGETMLGFILATISIYMWQLSSNCSDPFTFIIPAIIILLVGLICILFGVETYFLRDDPDIWR